MNEECPKESKENVGMDLQIKTFREEGIGVSDCPRQFLRKKEWFPECFII